MDVKIVRGFLFFGFGLVILTACATSPVNQVYSDAKASTVKDADAPDGVIRAVPMPSAPLDVSKTIDRIVFASCAQQNEDQSIWNKIAAEQADLVLYIGDNVYGDVRSGDAALPELKTAYMRLAQSEPFANARASAPMLTTWDDHDFGLNDAGANFKYKDKAQDLFNYVWAVPADDARRDRPGIYQSWMIGDEQGKRLQIIMLDTRYFRSELKPSEEYGTKGKERYVPDADPSKTMLGEAQWAWLESELEKPADIRLLVSSIQVIAEGHGWEAWRTLPAEREKLYSLIKKTGAEDVVVLSGDRHSAAFYQRNDVLDYPLFEATSSSLNLPASVWRAESGETYVEPGPYRLGGMVYEANYGVLEIDWATKQIYVSLRSDTGETYQSHSVDLD